MNGDWKIYTERPYKLACAADRASFALVAGVVVHNFGLTLIFPVTLEPLCSDPCSYIPSYLLDGTHIDSIDPPSDVTLEGGEKERLDYRGIDST